MRMSTSRKRRITPALVARAWSVRPRFPPPCPFPRNRTLERPRKCSCFVAQPRRLGARIQRGRRSRRPRVAIRGHRIRPGVLRLARTLAMRNSVPVQGIIWRGRCGAKKMSVDPPRGTQATAHLLAEAQLDGVGTPGFVDIRITWHQVRWIGFQSDRLLAHDPHGVAIGQERRPRRHQPVAGADGAGDFHPIAVAPPQCHLDFGHAGDTAVFIL